MVKESSGKKENIYYVNEKKMVWQILSIWTLLCNNFFSLVAKVKNNIIIHIGNTNT